MLTSAHSSQCVHYSLLSVEVYLRVPIWVYTRMSPIYQSDGSYDRFCGLEFHKSNHPQGSITANRTMGLLMTCSLHDLAYQNPKVLVAWYWRRHAGFISSRVRITLGLIVSEEYLRSATWCFLGVGRIEPPRASRLLHSGYC